MAVAAPLNGQTIYQFGTATTYPNPGWVSASNITGSPSNVLNFQPNCGFVSTNDLPFGNRYANSQITTYTSPVINTACQNGTTARVTINGRSTLEDTYDWMYFMYSLDGGTTWINPVAQSSFVNLSGVNLGAYPPLTNYTSTNSNRNGWTGTFGATNFVYVIPASANTRFRFLFESSLTGNSYLVLPATTYDRYFDILGFDVVCNVVTPVELKTFTGKSYQGDNVLLWKTETEHRNDYFRVEWTADPEEGWEEIAIVDGAGNSQTERTYNLTHATYRRGKTNYYRLVQVDTDGVWTIHDELVAIDNSGDGKTVVKVVNLMGQEVAADAPGLVIVLYEDGSMEKRYNP